MRLTYADRILEVNHAGEHGAVNIYRGQRLVCFWRDESLKRELEELREHEERDRAIFAAGTKKPRSAPLPQLLDVRAWRFSAGRFDGHLWAGVHRSGDGSR